MEFESCPRGNWTDPRFLRDKGKSLNKHTEKKRDHNELKTTLRAQLFEGIEEALLSRERRADFLYR